MAEARFTFVDEAPAPAAAGESRFSFVEDWRDQFANQPQPEAAAVGLDIADVGKFYGGGVAQGYKGAVPSLAQSGAELVNRWRASTTYAPQNYMTKEQRDALFALPPQTTPGEAGKRPTTFGDWLKALTPEQAAQRETDIFNDPDYQNTLAASRALGLKAQKEMQGGTWVADLTKGIVEMAPSMAAAMATGGITAFGETTAMIASLTPMAAHVYGQAIAEGRDKYHLDEGANIDRAALYVAAETIPEVIPLHLAFKPGSSLLKRMLQTGVAEAPSEAITELIEIGIDQGLVDPQHGTVQDALKYALATPEGLERLGYAGALGFGMGLVMAMPGALLEREKERAARTPEAETKAAIADAAPVLAAPDAASAISEATRSLTAAPAPTPIAEAPTVDEAISQAVSEVGQRRIEPTVTTAPLAPPAGPRIESVVPRIEAQQQIDEAIAATAPEATNEPHQYASTQVALSDADALTIKNAALSHIKREDIHPVEGLEDRPHITVKYGLEQDVTPDQVKAFLGEGPVDVTVGRVGMFEPEGKDYDVIIQHVHSADLEALNATLTRNLPNVETHPEYQPHITLGYVNRGEGHKYLDMRTGLEGKTLTFDRLEFAGTDETVTPLDLTARVTAPVPAAGVTVDDIHALADQKGIAWDNEPAFLALTKRVTGKEHLDELSPDQRQGMIEVLRAMPAPVTLEGGGSITATAAAQVPAPEAGTYNIQQLRDVIKRKPGGGLPLYQLFGFEIRAPAGTKGPEGKDWAITQFQKHILANDPRYAALIERRAKLAMPGVQQPVAAPPAAEALPQGGAAEVAPKARALRPAPAAPLTDARLKRDWHRGALANMASELVKGGGVSYIRGTDQGGAQDQIVGRTGSANPEWFQRMNENKETSISVEALRKAVDKALAGEKLGAREARVVTHMLDEATGIRTDPQEIERLREELAQRREARRGPNRPVPPLAVYDTLGETYAESEYTPDMRAEGRGIYDLAQALDEAGGNSDAILEQAATNEEAIDALEVALEQQLRDNERARGREEEAAPGQVQQAPAAEAGPTDLAGAVPVGQQALADEIRRREAAKQRGTTTDLTGTMFGQDIGQQDLMDMAGVDRRRETITPAEDTAVGVNAAGEPLYERKDGSRYRMHAGRPDFGGDLAPVEKPTAIDENLTVVSTTYASGMNREFDMQGAIDAGVPFGVDVGLLSPARLDQLVEAAKSVKVFIDSGAFRLFRESLRGESRKQLELAGFGPSGFAIDAKQVLMRYRDILLRADREGFTDYRNFAMVMPDVVGNAEATLKLLEDNHDAIVDLIDEGVDVIVPYQRGMSRDSVVEILGDANVSWRYGIPSNAEAMSIEEMVELVRTSGSGKVHLLGAASAAKAADKLDALRKLNDELDVTMDGNILRSRMDALKGTSGAARTEAIATLLRDLAPSTQQVRADSFGQEPTGKRKAFEKAGTLEGPIPRTTSQGWGVALPGGWRIGDHVEVLHGATGEYPETYSQSGTLITVDAALGTAQVLKNDAKKLTTVPIGRLKQSDWMDEKPGEKGWQKKAREKHIKDFAARYEIGKALLPTAPTVPTAPAPAAVPAGLDKRTGAHLAHDRPWITKYLDVVNRGTITTAMPVLSDRDYAVIYQPPPAKAGEGTQLLYRHEITDKEPMRFHPEQLENYVLLSSNGKNVRMDMVANDKWKRKKDKEAYQDAFPPAVRSRINTAIKRIKETPKALFDQYVWPVFPTQERAPITPATRPPLTTQTPAPGMAPATGERVAALPDRIDAEAQSLYDREVARLTESGFPEGLIAKEAEIYRQGFVAGADDWNFGTAYDPTHGNPNKNENENAPYGQAYQLGYSMARRGQLAAAAPVAPAPMWKIGQLVRFSEPNTFSPTGTSQRAGKITEELGQNNFRVRVAELGDRIVNAADLRPMTAPGERPVLPVAPPTSPLREAVKQAAKDYGTKNTIFTKDAADQAYKDILDSLDDLNVGINPKLMTAMLTRVGYHVEAGARAFADVVSAMVNEFGPKIRPFLKGAYNNVRDYPGFDNTDMDDAATVAAYQFEEGATGVPGGRADMERGGAEGPPAGLELGPQGVPVGPEGAGDLARGAGQDVVAGRLPGQGDLGLPGGGAAVPGAPGDQSVLGDHGQIRPEERPAGGVVTDRGGVARDHGVSPERLRAAAALVTPKQSPLKAQRDADRITVKPGDDANIIATLPNLLPGQHSDVLKAERRYASSPLPGFMLTNGTGTGKTFSGLGVVKRWVRQHGSDVLIVAPSQKVISDWQKTAANFFDLPVHILEGIQDEGRGVTATTYANFEQNYAIYQRKWGLIVYDESHNLLQEKTGAINARTMKHFSMTLHPDRLLGAAYDRVEPEFAPLRTPEPNPPRGQKPRMVLTQAQNEELRRRAETLQKELIAGGRPKVLYLSATPFAYRKSIDYADTHLFDFSEGKRGPDGQTRDDYRGYNRGSDRDQFFMQHFGYRMLVNKLTEPESDVDRALMERRFNEYLKESGALSRTVLDIDKDYSRQFFEYASDLGKQIDEGMFWVRGWYRDEDGNLQTDKERQKKYELLATVYDRRWDYHYMNALLEAINAREAVNRVRAHLALGRKVVVFHRYKTRTATHPFQIKSGDDDVYYIADRLSGPEKSPQAHEEVKGAILLQAQRFQEERPDLWNLDLDKLVNPIPLMQKEFGGQLALFNGDISTKQRKIDMDRFAADESGLDIVLVQIQAGKEGISMHDITGKRQRALISIGLPIQATDAIQMEGRIYRQGNQSNAVLEYLKANLAFEEHAFAQAVAQRSSTAENLAMGNEARDLMTAFVDGYNNPAEGGPSLTQGIGGKVGDRRRMEDSPWSMAKTFYWAQAKKTSQTKAREGKDYFATPEPLGLKMVEWLGLSAREKALEPSAGHGAIARWFPDNTRNVYVEQSPDLVGKLELNARNGRVRAEDFMTLPLVNKFHGIAMNPPFGVGGSDAIKHLEKAGRHLYDGGRIVAIIPKGPAADAKFEKWLYNDAKDASSKGLYLTKTVDLPTVTFERAATQVATRIVVIDRSTDPALVREQSASDLSDIQKIGELFDRLEQMGAPRRPVIPEAAKVAQLEEEVEAPPAVEAAPKTLAQFVAHDQKHSKTGAQQYLVIPSEYLGPAWSQVNTMAKAAGGYWSSYQKKDLNIKKGWVFDSQAKRDAFLGKVNEPGAVGGQFELRDVTQTPEFKAWFGDSKVVDANDRPLIVHHSTNNEFDAFDPSTSTLGSHFGTFGQANVFAGGLPGEQFVLPQRTIPVYLSIKNPIRLIDYGDWWPRSVAENLRDTYGIEVVAGATARPSVDEKVPPLFRSKVPALNDADVRYAIEKAGYDGIIYLNRGEIEGVSPGEFEKRGGFTIDMPDAAFKQRFPEARDSWIAFRPEQIKSATGNVGTFNPRDPRFGFSLAEPNPLGFYSGLARAATALKQDRGTPEQMLAALTKTPGVKPVELEWTGLTDYIKALKDSGVKSISKADIIDYLDANGVQVNETVLGTDPRPKQDEVIFATFTSPNLTWTTSMPERTASAGQLFTAPVLLKGEETGYEVRYRGATNAVSPDEVDLTPFTNQNGGTHYHTEVRGTPFMDIGSLGGENAARQRAAELWNAHQATAGEFVIFYNAQGVEAALGKYATQEFALKRVKQLLQEDGLIAPPGATLAKYNRPELVTPGPSENYREIIFSLPLKPADMSFVAPEIARIMTKYDIPGDIGPGESDPAFYGRIIREYATRMSEAELKLFDEARRTSARPRQQEFIRSHFAKEVGNDFAHMRVSDRTSVDGKRLLYVDEHQSDWNRLGAAHGFAPATIKTDLSEARARRLKFEPLATAAIGRNDRLGFDRNTDARSAILENDDWLDRWEVPAQADRDAINAWRDAANEVHRLEVAEKEGVPDMPFKGNAWKELQAKRLIRLAAEGNYDGIAWVTGQLTRDRYDLNRYAREIAWTVRDSGMKNVTITLRDSSPLELVINNDGVIKNVVRSMAVGGGGLLTGKNVEELVGKEIAKRIVEERNGVLTGTQLNLGAQWPVNLYDRTLPNIYKSVARKLDKKANVGTIDIATGQAAHDIRVEIDEHGRYFLWNDLLQEQMYGDVDWATEAEAIAARERLITNIQPGGEALTIKRDQRTGRYYLFDNDENEDVGEENYATYDEARLALHEVLVGADMAQWLGSERAKQTVHYLPITDDMRRLAVHDGQSIFSTTDWTSVGTATDSIGVDGVRRAIAPMVNAISAKLDIKVRVMAFKDAPAWLHAKVPPGSQPRGYMFGNEIMLFPEFIQSERAAQQVLTHELIGHIGVFRVVGENWGELMGHFDTLENSGDARFKELWDETLRRYEGLNRDAQVAEFIAVAAEHRFREGPLGEFMRKVREILLRVLRALGFTRPMGMTDIDLLLTRSENYIKTGLGTAGERGPPTGLWAVTPPPIRQDKGVETPPAPFTDAQTEQRWQAAREGIGDQRTVVQRVSEFIAHTFHGFTRHHIDLPREARFALAQEALRQFEAAPAAAKEEAIRRLTYIVRDLTPAEYDLLSRKVLLDDLAYEDELGHDLPFNFTSETLRTDKAAIDAQVAQSVTLQQRLLYRQQMNEALRDDLIEAGILSAESAANPAYFRHQVLTYARMRQLAQGAGNVKTPRPGYAMHRKGSLEDINANYLEAEFEYLHRAMIDLKTVQTIDKIELGYDISDELKALAPEGTDWRDTLPDGYSLWQPRKGNLFYTGTTVAERAMDRLMEALSSDPEGTGIAGMVDAEAVQDLIDSARQALVMGGKRRQFAIPTELATTLDAMVQDVDRGLFDHIFADPLKWWKQWVLINPRRVLKYNINNLSGDADAVIAGNPRVLKKMPAAIKELWGILHGAEPSIRYREAVERGVFDAGLTVQEIPDINLMDQFQHVIRRPSAAEAPVAFAKSKLMGVWNFLRDYTRFRENWLRYAAYLDYVERLEGGETVQSIGYGASNPAMVDEIAANDVKDGAALLARDLVGDYGDVSHFGIGIRRRVIPFYSWMEVNTGRYVRLIRNAYGQGLGKGLKTGGVVAAGLGLRTTAYLATRMALMYMLVQLWNQLFHRDDEDKLSDEDRVRLHINLGEGPDGQIRTIRFQGALSDFLQWFGFEDAVAAATHIESGRADFSDVLKAMAKGAPNKLVHGLSPLFTTPIELFLHVKLFPDVFNPRPSRDQLRTFAQVVSLENEYDVAATKPSRGYVRSLENTLFYQTDAGEAAYNKIRSMAYQWNAEKRGQSGLSNIETDRSIAIYEWKTAVRYGDVAAADAARAKLRELKVKGKDLRQSIRMAAPLGMMAKHDKPKFKQTLSPRELQTLEAADAWYRQTYLHGAARRAAPSAAPANGRFTFVP